MIYVYFHLSKAILRLNVEEKQFFDINEAAYLVAYLLPMYPYS